jgi:hypothetical protein
MTPSERKKAERQRKRSAGLVPLEVWVRREDVPALKDFVASLTGVDEKPE